MALDQAKLDPTGSGSKGTKTLAIYETADTKATVKGAGYFNAAANIMARVGMMWIVASDATFPVKVSVAAGVVTIALPDVYT
ncbi:MAG TPA: hypothetical protein VJM50_06460 [Pyrinomonadaceae bacterium]|nr:hypothetical protein [Pyrinomonadaceae bacterium]